MARPERGTPEEKGVTHLGMVPEGLSFIEAIRATAPQRKYPMDHARDDGRLTICNTLRHARTEAEKLPEGAEREHIIEYLEAATDFAKRMDARLREFRIRLRAHGISIE